MKACVISAHFKEDLSWIVLSKFPVVVYSKTIAASANYIKINKSQECLAYLKFIIENYHDLPLYTIFVHGHRNSEHQDDNIENKINGLKFDRPIINLNRPDFYNVLSASNEKYQKEWGWLIDNWNDLFGNALPFPEALGFPACAQFAVHRDCITRHSLDFWLSIFQWALINNLENSVNSRVLEYCWYYLFTGKQIVTKEEVSYQATNV